MFDGELKENKNIKTNKTLILVCLLMLFSIIIIILLIYLKNGDVYAIPEEDTIYIDGTNMEIIGTRNYFYFKEGVKQEFELGNSYSKKI